MIFKRGINNYSSKASFRLNGVTLILIILGIIALVFTAYYAFLVYSYNIGDYVYSKKTLELGKIDGVDPLKFGYLIKWTTGNYSSAPIWSIDSVSNINKSASINPQRNVTGTTTSNPAFNKEDNFNDYVISKNTSNPSVGNVLFYFSESGQFNYTGKSNCSPDFMCSDWGICHLEYNLNLILEKKALSGKSYRFCKDNNQCLPNIIDSKICEDKVNITTRVNKWCGQDYLEIIDDSGQVLARLSNQDKENYMDVNLNILDKGYCYYCYDGKRDFDETGKDCGGSCSACA